MIKSIFEAAVKYEQKDNLQLIEQIVDWCVLNWYQLATEIRRDRAVLDICKEHEQQKAETGSNLFPLHEFILSKGATSSSSSAIGTLLMFKKNAANMTPTSKVLFYSDENGVSLEYEIAAGNEGIQDMPPQIIRHGQVWVRYDQGTVALLPKQQQTEAKSSLPCTAVLIPALWPVCCWLTEHLTNALLLNPHSVGPQAIQIFSKLLEALGSFNENALAPSVLKSVVLQLISRLLRKLRYLLKAQGNTPAKPSASHIEQIFIKPDFLHGLIGEMVF